MSVGNKWRSLYDSIQFHTGGGGGAKFLFPKTHQDVHVNAMFPSLIITVRDEITNHEEVKCRSRSKTK